MVNTHIGPGGLETRDLSSGENTIKETYLTQPFGTFRPSLVQKLLIGLGRATPLHRGKMRYLLSQLIYKLGKPVDIRRNGGCFRIGMQQNLIEYGLLLHPRYNQDEIDFLCEPLGPGKVGVDIGSNIGLYSVALSMTGARVVSVDANPAMAAQLRFNMAASGKTPDDVVHSAVGDVDGRVTLQIRNDDVAIVNVIEDVAGDVEIRRLETILADLGVTRVDVLKIDIEGFEDKALGPYLENATGDMIPDRIVIERAGADDYPACVKQFDRLGYKVVGRTRNNSLYQRQP